MEDNISNHVDYERSSIPRKETNHKMYAELEQDYDDGTTETEE